MIADQKLETLEKSSIRLTITVGKDDARKHYDDLISKYAKTAQIKGFRRGKVPASILEQKFGESIRGEASMNIIEDSLKEAFETVEKKPLQFEPPTLDEETELELELGKDFTFTVTYDYYPDIELGQYKGVEIEEPSVSILAADIKRELETVQEQNSVVMDKASGGVVNENIVTLNYVELGDDGEEITGTSREDFVFTVGSGYNRYKIDEELIGMERDEEKNIEKTFAEDFEDSELAGTTVKLKVKVILIKEKQLPELDDELAQDVSDEYKTLDDLKKSIKSRLKETADQHIRQANIESLVAKIRETSKVDLPESMVKAELGASWQNFISRSGLKEEQLLQVLEQQERSQDDLYEEWRPSAETSILTRLLMTTILEEEKLEVPDEELDKEISASAEQSNMTPEQARENFEKNNMIEYIRNQILDRKLYDFLLKSAVKKKGEKVKFLDLVQNSQ
jgi:trigger factor